MGHERRKRTREGEKRPTSTACEVRRGSVSGANSAREICVLAPSPSASANAAIKETFFGSAEVFAKFDGGHRH